MYTRQEASRIKQAFWTAYGQYMRPVPSATGEKVNWVNYKTGIKNLYFRMHADKNKGYIAIEFTHPNLTIQQEQYDQMVQMRTLLEEQLQEPWDWLPMTSDDYGKVISQVKKEIIEVNIFNQDDWPRLISFFKPRIISLDAFWSFAKYSFEAF